MVDIKAIMHHSQQGNDDPICHICDEKSSNHTGTNGQNGTKIIQYFACLKFVEMTPAERFNTIKIKRIMYPMSLSGSNAIHRKALTRKMPT